jgi:UDP-N-acetylmuramoyl-L-alanyl-D-glutamate--2,6-diaminopimelate ligase
MKLSDLLEDIKDVRITSVKGDIGIDIAGISNDSRTVAKNYLFAARKGSKVDSNKYIKEAIARGAVCILSDEPAVLDNSALSLQATSREPLVLYGRISQTCERSESHITFINVDDAKAAYAVISRNFFKNPSSKLKVIGITGTNGKTTTSFLIDSILKTAGFSSGLIGTINYQFSEIINPSNCKISGRAKGPNNTTPDPYDLNEMLNNMVLNGSYACVIEVSSHSLVQKRVYGIDFDIAIFTNLTRDHLDYHLDMESYYQAKKLFFTDILLNSSKDKRSAVINIDDIYGRRLLDELKKIKNINKFDILTYSLTGNSDIFAKNVKFNSEGVDFDLQTPSGIIKISSKLIGSYNIYNILSAAAAAHAMSIPFSFIESGISNLYSVPGRVERVNINDAETPFICVDYAHTDDALERVLQALKEISAGRLICVFGCGGDRDKGKRPLMGKHSGRLADITIITSDNPRNEDPIDIIKEVEEGVKENASNINFSNDNLSELKDAIINVGNGHVYIVVPDRNKAINTALAISNTKDAVLIAGKGHEDYMIVGDKKYHFSDKEEVLKFYG